MKKLLALAFAGAFATMSFAAHAAGPPGIVAGQASVAKAAAAIQMIAVQSPKVTALAVADTVKSVARRPGDVTENPAIGVAWSTSAIAPVGRLTGIIKSNHARLPWSRPGAGGLVTIRASPEITLKI